MVAKPLALEDPPPAAHGIEKRAVALERRVAQQEEELHQLRWLTSRTGIVNAMVGMLLVEAKDGNKSREDWASTKRRLLLCLHPDKLVAKGCAEDLVKALQNHVLWN